MQSLANNAGGTDETLTFTPGSDIRYEVRIQAEPGDFMLALLDFSGLATLNLNSTVVGTLSTGDATYPMSSYYMDEYRLTVSSNSDIRVTLFSSSFSPLCAVLNAETGELINYTSADPGTVTVTFFAKKGVTYSIQVSSDIESKTGY